MLHSLVGRIAPLIAAAAFLCVADAEARPKRGEPPPPVVDPGPALIPEAGDVWAKPLPLDHGATPNGLAHPSAQACAGCHPHVVAEWAASAHAGPPSQLLWQAAREIRDERCVSCHLPLTAQWASPPGADAANPAFDATLAAEGVTCAACHVREGVVHAARPRPVAPAPHALAWTASLDGAAGCVACHQLTLPGASTALYDTVGEWRSSPWAAAGVTCVDCHGGAMPGGPPTASHALRPDGSRGLTVLIDLPSDRLARREQPWPTTIRLLNTGAGHSLPTGSPFVAWTVQAALVGPPNDKGVHPRVAVLERPLARTLAPEAPYALVSDTRIAAGSGAILDWPLPLGFELPAGAWTAEVQVRAIRGGVAADPPLYTINVPLWVE